MKIGLLGFPLVNANKGCEALTYSIIDTLHRIVDERIEIIVFNTSKNPLLEELYPDIRFTSVKAKIKDGSCFREFKKCDFIFDATSGDGFSDIYFKKLVFRTTLMKQCVIMSGTSLVLMPQTYGPFTSSFLRKFAVHTINKSLRVYSRDQKSIDYLKQFCKKKIFKTTDLAFSLPYTKKIFENTVLNVGINISGLLWKGGFEKENQFGLSVNYKEYITMLIKTLLKENINVHLIPHVIENANDNIDGDVDVCKKIYKKMNASTLFLAENFKSPIDAKNYIAGMDVFIGARMHSTIAAFSSEVPVIPFSYSRKFEGLYENLNYPYIIHGQTESTDLALKHTLELIEKRATLKQTINNEMKTVAQYQKRFESDLKELISLRSE